MGQNEVLCGNGLTVPKGQISDSSKLKNFAGDNFKFQESGRKFSKRVENTVGKRRNCSLRANSVF